MPPVLDSVRGRRVLVTGHTGFKGAWLAAYLHELGAEVFGFALPAEARGAFHELGVASFAHTTIGDVRDRDGVRAALAECAPDIVFHLAAQPLVRRGWSDPHTTFETNAMGTVNVVDTALRGDTVAGVVVATTDKVYVNDGADRPFVETDRLGGDDPYSASKAAAELALVPYRRGALMGLRDVPIVSVRAGNVIGGGDWSEDRLVPDVIRALESGDKIVLRRPEAVRPWQHVLDCLYGYLLVGAGMLAEGSLSPAYNFAHSASAATVIDVARAVVRHWGAPEDHIVIDREDTAAEAGLLRLDPARAQCELSWAPAWSLDRSIAEAVRFYQDPSIGRAQLAAHMEAVAAQ